MFKNVACRIHKTNELTFVNEVLSMIVTKLLDIIDGLYIDRFHVYKKPRKVVIISGVK